MYGLAELKCLEFSDDTDLDELSFNMRQFLFSLDVHCGNRPELEDDDLH